MAKSKKPKEEPADELSLKEQANKILQRAKESGSEQSFMFQTTFRRYMECLAHLSELEKAIKEEGALVEKEYVKGRKNLYVNPAINAYNSTVAMANNTAQILMRCIVDPLPGGDTSDAFDDF
jgi:hypothetical protein